MFVSTSTSGSNRDPDGYLLSVDSDPTVAIGISAARNFLDLPVGDHTVQLTGIAANCAVQDLNPRTVSVAAGSQSVTTFDVICDPLFGNLEITTRTNGIDLDPDGYTVQIDDGESVSIGLNEVLTVTNLPIGDHKVVLRGTAINCLSGFENPRTVTVVANTTVATEFQIECVAPADPAIAFVKSGFQDYLTVIDADGSNETTLYGSATIREPAFRPDGSQILFRMSGSIWAIDLAFESGTPVWSNLREFLPGCSCDVDWAPDGDRIAVAASNDVRGLLQIFSSDGVLEEDLLEVPGRLVKSPTWAPGGDRIAFRTRVRPSGPYDIRIVDVNSGTVTIIDAPPLVKIDSGGIAWSRTTDRYLAIEIRETIGEEEIFILDLTDNSAVFLGAGRYPTWSPDDQQIVFFQPFGEMVIATGGVGNWSVSSLTGNSAYWPDWR